MITAELLGVVVVIELAGFAILITWYLAGGALADRGERQREDRVARARRQLAAVLERDLRPGALEDLAHLPLAEQMRAFREVGGSLAGAERERLRAVAADLGLVARAESATRDRRWWRRLEGLRALGVVSAAVPGILRLVDDPHHLVRAQAIELAAEQPSEEVIERLVAHLYDPARVCRFAVHDSLLRIGASAVPALVGALARGGAGTAEPLGVARWVGDSRLSAPAVRLTAHSDARVRAHAATLLGRLGGEGGVATLRGMLADPEADVRAAAARALGRLGVSAAAAQLAEALRDEAWSVRREAAIALTKLGPAGEVLLREAVGRDDAYASDIARNALDLRRLGLSEVGL